MKKKFYLIGLIVFITGVYLTSTNTISVKTMPPVVVKTVPQAGDTSVDPSLQAIKVTFSKEMLTDNQWSFVKVPKALFPERPGKIYYLKDKRTCVMPVKLEPDKTYAMWINRGQYNYFKDISGRSSVPYLLVFETR